MSWYRDSDGKIITDEEFQSDCFECSVFCSEGTITIPCNGERTDCPHFKEVDTSDYDKEIRSKVIDEFAEKLSDRLTGLSDNATICGVKNVDFLTLDTVIDEIGDMAEQMKGE